MTYNVFILPCYCEILYTEDLSDGQVINGTLKIINPFIHNDIVNIIISEK
jgi:predicted nucleic acid-binding protein